MWDSWPATCHLLHYSGRHRLLHLVFEADTSEPDMPGEDGYTIRQGGNESTLLLALRQSWTRGKLFHHCSCPRCIGAAKLILACDWEQSWRRHKCTCTYPVLMSRYQLIPVNQWLMLEMVGNLQELVIHQLCQNDANLCCLLEVL